MRKLLTKKNYMTAYPFNKTTHVITLNHEVSEAKCPQYGQLSYVGRPSFIICYYGNANIHTKQREMIQRQFKNWWCCTQHRATEKGRVQLNINKAAWTHMLTGCQCLYISLWTLYNSKDLLSGWHIGMTLLEKYFYRIFKMLPILGYLLILNSSRLVSI